MDVSFLITVIEFMAALFIFLLGVGVVTIAVLYVVDITQTKHAVRHNFPVVGRMRYFFEHLGEFFRQYFFAQDREEMPFNRAERSYVYRAAKNVDTTLAFGSTRDLRPTGTIIFANAAYPPLDQDAAPIGVLEIGPYARHPYRTASLFNISAMSYGAISEPAVNALSHGAKKAGIWMNTGEGGLSPVHLSGGCDVVFQMGTAKYGVRDADGLLSDDKLREVAAHEQVRMFEIKLSQGAKPGKGGILPAAKVSAEIAKIRGIPEGQDSISPNRHPDVDSAGELLDLIARIRDVTGKDTCSLLAASRHCNATKIPARPASPPTTAACKRVWTRSIRPSAWRTMRSTCIMKLVSSPIPAVCVSRGNCNEITAGLSAPTAGRDR